MNHSLLSVLYSMLVFQHAWQRLAQAGATSAEVVRRVFRPHRCLHQQGAVSLTICYASRKGHAELVELFLAGRYYPGDELEAREPTAADLSGRR